MRFASLGSGSEGNALVVQAGKTIVLMDCGFTLSDTCMRLARLGLTPDCLNGIVVTHEHSDHIAGVARLARKYSIPIWLTHGTFHAQSKLFSSVPKLTKIDSHCPFTINGLLVQPFPVPHDAVEPAQYTFSDGAKRLGVLTDIGCSTPHIEAMLSGCDALVLECNHDTALLANSDYPISLKQRVGGRFGHLSNADAAALLARLDCSRLQHIVAAHLSRKNNTPELAVYALSKALNCNPEWIAVAGQGEGLAWRKIV
ncbi:Metal-dependent hydrolases of the beta-lactamase superfamily I [Candidatus Nitrotoga sp. HW29]|uniref:MBL fold metallo-hydrolase n=1 Tax=Candidatus Nitrotoga sp. HW29 TaxID=2886963 RepID=UPI001EF2F33A|nr:MBL fold metallo-hydrolase [Candidatus Nitrotoga sp. HW29]CAH1904920.1 Metal-dependent hydrolases of the beta-lactamase superfamily I [Candidatus Nitrotoga sp. HW29]